MSVYKRYKHGARVKNLVNDYGVRTTFRSLRREMGSSVVRLKHNKIQTVDRRGNWKYLH